MNLRKTLAAAAVLCLGVLSAVALQDEIAVSASPPTEHHALLKEYAGKWNATTSMMGAESTGTETNAMIGELWCSTHYVGDFMGTPFEGLGIIGYDPEKQKYVMSWCDSMTASMSTGEGTYDKDKKALVMEVLDPNTKAIQTHINEFVDDDTRIFRMLGPVPGSDAPIEYMKVVYKRAK